MLLHKVLKQRKKEQGFSENTEATPYDTSQHTQVRGRDGFRAKQNSTIGAARQRSIGNRNNKPAR
ncbi:MAG: hypothetical protein COU32_02715 [Candidatus Magasanikbacteria bacterium CG10_big_fil_rev_8_21_14_0_10_42_10]|uniref:Uncharacterized protein n=2 Tax=Candidatus Magasanikiibacteriota TaxID=1752731 RepID=A0A2H0TVV0_9BACT|nr:MAG: hypothetical protein COU32_02715 [Candidatus Magasanikbacteria bacterium CG10_big_fil_rev_8_21_14_0_10_42_10]PIZ94499.1 MAG: hypothetical protein COX82_00490 [Candidatus Magasanikbacteria bacterium CG_4_10_14_0_2_um_filter_41_10]